MFFLCRLKTAAALADIHSPSGFLTREVEYKLSLGSTDNSYKLFFLFHFLTARTFSHRYLFNCQSDPSFRKGFLFLSLSFFLSLFLLALYSFIEAAFGAYVYLEACEFCGELRILTLVAYSK